MRPFNDAWDIVHGCQSVSFGCRFCIAKNNVDQSLIYNSGGINRWSRAVQIFGNRIEARLELEPNRNRRVEVCPNSDLFYDEIDDWILYRVFDVMAATPNDTYFITTKRPERMYNFVRGLNYRYGQVLPNVALGVSVEHRETFKPRVEILKQTPAAIRYVVFEPLLEQMGNIGFALGGLTPVDWVLVGGEINEAGRPFDLNWAFEIREQCHDRGVPFWFLGPGSNIVISGLPVTSAIFDGPGVNDFWNNVNEKGKIK